MGFKDIINNLENEQYDEDYIIKKGSIPILFTAVHTMKQIRKDNTIKLKEPYTKAIALYLNKYFNANCMVKIKDTKLDSNKDNHDEFKKDLIDYVKENDIKLVIDLHGANKDNDFDIEFGTLNNLTTDFSTLKELENSFIENGITNIVHNDPFKGGAITQYLFNLKDVDAIQLEINYKYRDYNNLDNLEKLCKSLIDFIDKYNRK